MPPPRATLQPMFPPVKIVSGGLEIREYGPQDTDQVTGFLTAGDRTALPPGAPHDTGDVPDWLAQGVHRHRLGGGGVHLLILTEHTGQILGSIGLRDADWDAGTTELGYGIHTAHRGRGHATEAARAVGRWALTDGGMRRVQLRARVDNLASLRVAEKAGYHREGTLRHAEWDAGQAHDLAVFSLISTDLDT
jgi:RimJ/RimL family protein N-acetyltransferase